jgi:hypothetical protein
MGIEPKGSAIQSLGNAAFSETRTAACDWRANFRRMRDNVGPRETTTPVTLDFRCVPRTAGGERQVSGKVHPLS